MNEPDNWFLPDSRPLLDWCLAKTIIPGPRLLPWLAAALLLGGVADCPAQTYIQNNEQIPLWNQHGDFRAGDYGYNGIDSSIPAAGGNNATGPFVTFDNLAADGRTKYVLNAAGNQTSKYSLAGTGRLFMANDYYNAAHNGGADIAGGGWFCAPTATGMWMEWLRQNSLPNLGDRGGETASITAFGYDANCNQRKTPPGNGVGQLGTFRGPMITAANNYVRTYYNSFFGPNPRIAAWNYSQNAFTRMIDDNKPIVLFYENLNAMGQPTGSGHVVVGVGYQDTNAIVKDPWDATQKNKPFSSIRQLNDGLGQGTAYGDDPPSSSFDAPWTRVREEVMDIASYGQAPSSYETLPDNPTGYQSGDREWLGDSPVTNDGVVFLTCDPVNGVTVQVTVSSESGMSLDSAFETDAPAVLYLNAWVDWDQDFVWEPAEQVVEWSGAADFQGKQVLTINFPMPPNFTGQAWARFRLSRGQSDPPLGFSRFGEVEDYLISEIAPPPETIPMVVPRTAGLTVKVALPDIATNWSTLPGYPVELTAINFTSTNGQPVYPINLQTNEDGSYVIGGSSFLGYVNPANVNDQISYTITDSLGGTTAGLINIVVSTSPLFGQITGIVSPGGQSVTLNFAGYPGYRYSIQRSTDLLNWTTIGTVTAPPSGPFTYTDNFGDLGGNAPVAAYYRLEWIP